MLLAIYQFILGSVVIPLAMLGLMGTVARFFLITYVLILFIPIGNFAGIIYFWQRPGFKPLSIGLIFSLVIVIFMLYKISAAHVVQ